MVVEEEDIVVVGDQEEVEAGLHEPSFDVELPLIQKLFDLELYQLCILCESYLHLINNSGT